LEPRETALQVKNSFDFYRKNGTAETMDMGMIMQAILKNGVGPRTEGILKAIHQGVILSTAYEIKHKVTKAILTKDVRTKVHASFSDV
jgi:ABC-type enterochelin transport system permease subunit